MQSLIVNKKIAPNVLPIAARRSFFFLYLFLLGQWLLKSKFCCHHFSLSSLSSKKLFKTEIIAFIYFTFNRILDERDNCSTHHFPHPHFLFSWLNKKMAYISKLMFNRQRAYPITNSCGENVLFLFPILDTQTKAHLIVYAKIIILDKRNLGCPEKLKP